MDSLNKNKELIVDLHIHSHYSRATSKHLNIEELYKWGKIKGINVMGTGDFTHPAWLRELMKKLEPAEPGLYKLKKEYSDRQDTLIPESCKKNKIRFVLSVEISNIYSKGGKVRKVHNVVIVPDFKSALQINKDLSQIGNLEADGRPILGMDSVDLLKISLSAHADSLFIPAHIWTPWFAIFGSKSGFDSLEEAFGDMAKHIHAVETGLSSDPFMNWRLSGLDNVTLVSNSDAHSPQKLAREANIMITDYDYFQIVDAIKKNDERFVGTIEFFPEEGKYHLDGHRVCDFRSTPKETAKIRGVCPKCQRKLVIGVENRIEELADKPEHFIPKKHNTVEYIVPLVEILAEVNGVKGTKTKTVTEAYDKLIATFGHEFSILRNVSLEDLKREGFDVLAEAIRRLRKKEVHVDPGYDGVFGTVSFFKEGEIKDIEDTQLSLL